MVILFCGCEVTEDGKFVVSDVCKGCRECLAISKLHPFGHGRFE